MQRRGWYVDDDDDRDDVDVTAAVSTTSMSRHRYYLGGEGEEDDVTTCDSPHVLDAVPPSSMASLGAHPSLASRERDRRALPPSLSSLLRLLPPPPQSPRPLPQRGRAGERGQRRRRLNAVVSDAAHPYPPSAPPPPPVTPAQLGGQREPAAVRPLLLRKRLVFPRWRWTTPGMQRWQWRWRRRR